MEISATREVNVCFFSFVFNPIDKFFAKSSAVPFDVMAFLNACREVVSFVYSCNCFVISAIFPPVELNISCNLTSAISLNPEDNFLVAFSISFEDAPFTIISDKDF